MSRVDHTVPGDRRCPDCRKLVTVRHFLRNGSGRCGQSRGAPRFWTTARIWRLAELTERGHSDARIAATLSTQWGRPLTAAAVEQARERHGLPGPTQTALSARAVSLMLGLTYVNKVLDWLANGWLRGTRGPKVGPCPTWRVTREALWDFTEDPAHFHRWEPDVIADPALRLHAQRVRGDVRYVTATEAVLLLRERGLWVQRGTVEHWARTGHLPSVRSTVRETGRGGNRLIPVHDLATVVPPPLGGAAHPKRRAA